LTTKLSVVKASEGLKIFSRVMTKFLTNKGEVNILLMVNYLPFTVQL
jgi:hypothetical protein